MRRVELLSAVLLAKEIVQDAQPVAISSIRLGFRSRFLLPAAVCFYPRMTCPPPSNQLEIPQIVGADTMLPGSSGAMQLPEVAFPLSTLQVNTAYSLLRTLCTFCCENPGVLDTTAAMVQLPPVGDVRSPYQPAPAWPVPQLPLRGLSFDGDLTDEQEEYAENV